MLNRDEFIKMLSGLCEMFNKQPSEFIFDTYYDILKNYSNEQVRFAVRNCLKSHKWNTLPKPAELLEFIEGSKEDKALRAWVYVLEAIRKAGYYQTVEFKDKIIHSCLNELGGWQWLCSQQKDDLPFIEKRFLDLYRVFSARPVLDVPRLMGFFEVKNYETGHNTPKPVMIGYEEERLQITA